MDAKASPTQIIECCADHVAEPSALTVVIAPCLGVRDRESRPPFDKDGLSKMRWQKKAEQVVVKLQLMLIVPLDIRYK
jgi:hypothetical protein